MTADQNTIHYAALIRLQLAVSAIQDLLAATSEECAEDEGQALRIAAARQNATDAIHIALGAKIDPPKHLMRNWSNLNMVRDAAGMLKDSANA